MKSKLLILFLPFIFIGCATFSKKDFRKEITNLDENTIHNISGKYKIYPFKRFGKKISSYDHIDSLRKHGNLYHSITNENWEDKKILDSAMIYNKDNYHVDLKISNRTLLKVSFIENNTVVKDTTFNGKIKNGMFYVDNNYYKINGIPYLFGGYSSKKRRIGLSIKGNLIVNKAIAIEGAVLLIFGNGFSYNSSSEFERID